MTYPEVRDFFARYVLGVGAAADQGVLRQVRHPADRGRRRAAGTVRDGPQADPGAAAAPGGLARPEARRRRPRRPSWRAPGAVVSSRRPAMEDPPMASRCVSPLLVARPRRRRSPPRPRRPYGPPRPASPTGAAVPTAPRSASTSARSTPADAGSPWRTGASGRSSSRTGPPRRPGRPDDFVGIRSSRRRGATTSIC